MKKRKDGLYQTQVTITENGKKKQKYFYGKTPAEVKRKMIAYKGETEKGELFSVVADKWWAEHEPTLAHNSITAYRPALKRALDEFGDRRIMEITAKDISQYIDRFSKRYRGQRTVSRHLVIIGLIFKYAVVEGYAERNVAADVSVPKHLVRERRGLPSERDIQAIRGNVSVDFGLFAYFLLYTGCRRGEALAIQFKDIDRENKLIYITKSVYHESNSPKLKATKTEAGTREIALISRLESVLPKGNPDAYLFPNNDGGLMSDTQARYAWKRYCKTTGVTCTPHQLRHAYATRLWEMGIDVKDAQGLLGHASITTSQNIYTHVSQARKKQLAERLESM